MNSLTHQYITRTASHISMIYDETMLLEYCIKPDIDETEGAFKNHFYNPATRKNFRGERTSALTKLFEHYSKAIELNLNNNIKWIEELGRAVHFIQDMCTPVHTAYEDTFDAVSKLSFHQRFESFCDDLIKDYNYTMAVKYNDTFKSFLTSNDLKTLAKYCAMCANENLNAMNTNEKSLEQTAKDSINDAIIATMAVLAHHQKDIIKARR